MIKRTPSIIIILLWGCKGFFGTKTSLDFIDVPKYDSSIVTYVPVFPFLEGFIDPVQVLAGYDELLYVVDAGSDEIIAFDYAGRRLGSFYLKGVHAIAQDRQLNILALAEKDTAIQNTTLTLPAIYRLNLYNNGRYGIQYAKITRVIIHPYYFKNSATVKDQEVAFNAIAVFADNSYVVTRSGPDNSNPIRFGGPDDAVLYFNAQDQWQGIIEVQTIRGSERDYFKKPYGITTLAQPPQSPLVNTSKDFIVTMLEPYVALKVQYIREETGEQGSYYALNTDLIIGDTSRADGFLYEPHKFTAPVAVTFSGDGTNYIFVADTAKDSIYIFTSTGLEGVKPPPASPSTKYIKVSFGGTGNAPTQFNDPVSIAYIQKYVYVCDRKNRRICRYILTTDLED